MLLHTSTRPRAYVLVTGSGSNGEFNCLGKKINKQQLTSSYKGGLFLPQVPRISALDQFPFHFTVKQKLLSKSALSSSPVIFKAAPFHTDLLEQSFSSKKNRDFHRRPHKIQSRRQTRLAGALLHDFLQLLCEVISKMSIRTVFNRTSTHIFMSR